MRYIVDIEGIIDIDDDNFLHCGEVLINSSYIEYIGYKCRIKKVVKNLNKWNNSVYPYYTNYLTIKVDTSGVVAVDDGICHCEGIMLPVKLKKWVNTPIKITAIKPNSDRTSEYEMCAIKYRLISKKKLNTFVEPTVPIGEKIKVEVDANNRSHVGNVFISAKKKCRHGDFVKILKIGKNRMPEIESLYPLVATKLEKEFDTHGLAKIYSVEIDANGNIHADNILLPVNKCNEGDRIMILLAYENPVENTKGLYPLMAKKIVVLNPDIPNGEDRATAIVSKYEKYVKGNIKVLAAATILIILGLLGKFGLVKHHSSNT